jgi:hypothetical protein
VTQQPGETEAVRGTAAGTAAARGGRRLGLALFLVSAAQFTLQLDDRCRS